MKTLIAIIVLSLAGWGAYKFWPKSNKTAVTYENASVERQDLEKSIQASGDVKPQNRVELKPPLAGRLEQVLVQEGAWVKKGQIVAWISSSERAALLDAARARGPEDVKKWEELYKATPLLSPISGTLIARSFEPGQSVSAADAVLTVSDRLIVKASVDETDIAQVKVGQVARLTLDAYAGEPFDARVSHIAYEAKVVSNVTVYEVELSPTKAPSFMRSGMTATVDFITERREGVLAIPNDAIQPRKAKAESAMTNASIGSPDAPSNAVREPGLRRPGSGEGRRGKRPGLEGQAGGKGRPATVLVPGPAGKDGKAGAPVEKEVRLGFSDGKNTEVKDGLAEGDTVVIATQALPTAAAAGKNPFAPQRQQRAPRGAR